MIRPVKIDISSITSIESGDVFFTIRVQGDAFTSERVPLCTEAARGRISQEIKDFLSARLPTLKPRRYDYDLEKWVYAE